MTTTGGKRAFGPDRAGTAVGGPFAMSGAGRRAFALLGRVAAGLVAMLLILVGGLAVFTPGSATASPAVGAVRAAPVLTGSATSGDGRITLSVVSSAGAGTLPSNGSTVTFTYTVKNNTSEKAYYRSLGDSVCSSPNYTPNSGMTSDGTQWWIPGGGTATFTCGVLVTQDLTSTATATFDTSPGGGVAWAPSVATATTVVNVADDPCTTLWYASNTYNSAAGSIGTVATSGTSAMAAKWSIPALGNGANYPDSAALTVDPTTPTRAFFIPRNGGSNTYSGLWRLDLTTGASAQVVGNSTATNSVRLAAGRDGTVWSWATDGTLYSLARGATTWVPHAIASAKDVNGVSLASTSFASGDLTVGGNGNLWMLAAATSGTTYLLVVPAAETPKSAVAAVVVGKMNPPSAGGFYNGIAFAADGSLYASSGPNARTGATTAVNTIAKVDMNTGASTQVATAPTSSVGSVGDLGSCALPRSELRVLKRASTATPSVKTGDTITYTVEVANIGKLSSVAATLTDAIPTNTTYVPNSTTLNGVAVADTSGTMPYAASPAREVHGPGANPGVIPAGGKATVAFSVKVAAVAPDVTAISNQATAVDVNGAVLSDDPGNPAEDDPTRVPIAKSGIALTKTASTSQVAGAGQVTYTFVATNTGNDPLAGVRVTDVMSQTDGTPLVDSCRNPALAAGSDANKNGTLDPLEPWTYTCTQAVAWASGDRDPWQVNDTGTVTATGSVSGAQVTANASASVTVVPKPATIEVTKSAGTVVGPDSATGVLQATYTVSVANSGQVAGTYGPLTDTPAFASSLTPLGARFVRPNGSPGTWDPNRGPFQLTGASTSIGAGQVHDYKVTIDLAWTSTADAAPCSATPGPGQGLFNSVSLPAGQEAVTSDNGACIDPPVKPAPAIKLEKKAGAIVDRDGNGTTSAGDSIAYTFVVTNLSKTLTLTDVTVTDPLLSTVTCAATTLAVGASTTCTAASYALTQADVDARSVKNTATVTGEPPLLPKVSDTDSTTTTFDAPEELTIVKKATPSATPLKAGDTIDYTFTVTNTGSTSLTGIAVDDDLLKAKGIAVTCAATQLAPGASTTCDAASAYSVTTADITAGGVTNTATATAKTPGNGTETSPPVTVLSPVAAADPKITLDKTVIGVADSNGNGIVDASDVVTYGFTVKNVGNVPVQTIYVDDSALDVVGRGCSNAVLAPGESVTCTELAVPLGQATVDAGTFTNTATAVARYVAGGIDVQATDGARVDLSTTGTPPIANALTLTKKHGDILDSDSSGSVTRDDTLTYAFTVKNTGSQTLHDIKIVDAGLVTQPLTCVATLAPGETGTCLAPFGHQLSQADIDAGTVVNTATARGLSPTNATTTSPAATDTATIPNAPSLTLEKLAGPVVDEAGTPKGDSRGDKITYTLRVRNTSNVTVSGIAVTDALLAMSDATCGVTTLAPGADTECTGTYTLTRADVNALHVDNTASVTGTGPGGQRATDTAQTSTVLTPLPSIAVTKAAAPSGSSKLGDRITYTFTVENTGAGTLHGVSITDARVGLADAPCTDSAAALPSGDKMTCTVTATHTVDQADVDGGRVDNTATATALTAADAAVTATASASVPVEDVVAAITLKKAAGAVVDVDGNGFYSTRDTVTYTFTVTNTGPVTVSDPRIDDPTLRLEGFVCATGPLAPGASVTCTSPAHRLTDAEINAQEIVNTATATARASRGADPRATDSVTVALDAYPQVSLKKEAALADANGNGLGDAGESITYTFTVTNNGRAGLTAVTLSDPMLGASTPTCGVGAGLGTGRSVTCTATYTITADDVARGEVRNAATATGTLAGGVSTPASPEAVATTPTVVAAASVELKKSATLVDTDGDGLADLGDEIRYGFTIKNMGNVPVRRASVSDPMLLLAGALVACPDTEIAPGDSLNCEERSYFVTAADITRGTPIVNTATAQAEALGVSTPASTPATTSTTVAPVATPAGLRLTKTATISKDAGYPGLADVGDEITYGFVVTNSGASQAITPTVTDPMLTAAGLRVTCPGTVAAGATVTCTAPPYVVTAADLARGTTLVNTATASGGGLTSGPASQTVPLAPRPALTVVKSAAFGVDAGTRGVPDAGDTITYTFTITNTGATALTAVTLRDPMLRGIRCDAATLDPGASSTCTADAYTVTAADAARGVVTNTATAAGTPPKGPAVTDTDTAVVGRADPRIALVKKATLSTDDGVVGSADAGDVIDYTFTVTNTGNVPLTGVALSDPRLASTSCPADVLAPRASMTCTGASYTVTKADVDAGGSVENTARLTARPPTGDPIAAAGTSQVPVSPAPVAAFALTKSVAFGAGVNPSRVVVGDSLVYTFTVINTGNVRLAGVGVDDARLAALGITVACPAASLDPGKALTCRATRAYVVTAADAARGSVLNSAVARADVVGGGGEGPVVTPPTRPSDGVTVPVAPGAPTPTRPGGPNRPNHPGAPGTGSGTPGETSPGSPGSPASPGDSASSPGDPNSGRLPYTGADAAPVLLLGGTLVLGGLALIARSRRRHR